MAKAPTSPPEHRYDVCLSFAGEDRAYVNQLAHCLQVGGVRTFYDQFEKVQLWGKDLYSHLHDVYQNHAKYCIVFLSENYAKKGWTNHERRSAQARAFKESIEYILPVRFDDTEIQGISDTVGYIDLRLTTPEELCKIIVQKIGPRPRTNYFPPIPDRFFKLVKARTKKGRQFVGYIAHRFFQMLEKMNDVERGLIYDIFTYCCPAELPDNVHIDIDYLRRIAGMPPAKINSTLSNVRSLGFYFSIREESDSDDESHQRLFVLEWHNLSTAETGNYTKFANDIVNCATDNYCAEHGRQMFCRLDFGQLATSTTTIDNH
jgi:hypothetical protein